MRVLAVQPGDKAGDVLRLFSYEPADMIAAMQSQARGAVKARQALDEARAAEVVDEYREALDAYTYLDFSQ